MSDPMHILPCYYVFAAAAASDAPGPRPLYCVVHRPPRRRSWQTLPPPGASAVAPGQYNYAPIHEQALAVQEMGYEAYERLNKQVGGGAAASVSGVGRALQHAFAAHVAWSASRRSCDRQAISSPRPTQPQVELLTLPDRLTMRPARTAVAPLCGLVWRSAPSSPATCAPSTQRRSRRPAPTPTSTRRAT